MKNATITILVSVLFLSVHGQKNKPEATFYLFNDKWENINDIDKAYYFSRVVSLGDTCFQWDTYKVQGSILSSEQFTDARGQHAHGRQIHYHRSGFLDSIGNFIDEVPDGYWVYYNDTGRIISTKNYDKGRLIRVEDKLTRANPHKEKETAAKDEEEASFKGGPKAWTFYLARNIRYPKAASKYGISGQVIVDFIVNVEGNVEDVHLFKSAEVSLDEEAMRLILASPKWKPYVKKGEKVSSLKRQPMSFDENW